MSKDSGIKIWLHGKHGTGKHTLVSLCDYWSLARHKWYLRRDNVKPGNSRVIYYVCRKQNIRLHRQILGVSDSKVCCDHINGNTLDNRQSNLRIVTVQQNCCNRHGASVNNKSTGILGVKQRKPGGTYTAHIKRGSTRYEKSFKRLDDAMAQRESWEKELCFG